MVVEPHHESGELIKLLSQNDTSLQFHLSGKISCTSAKPMQYAYDAPKSLTEPFRQTHLKTTKAGR